MTRAFSSGRVWALILEIPGQPVDPCGETLGCILARDGHRSDRGDAGGPHEQQRGDRCRSSGQKTGRIRQSVDPGGGPDTGGSGSSDPSSRFGSGVTGSATFATVPAAASPVPPDPP